MFGVDPDIASSALRLWVAAGSAALLVFICALAFDWTRTRTVARIGVVVLGAVLGATLAWAFLDAASVRDRSAERRALETRAAELNAESLTPGSPLACLNGLAGEDVEAACEKALFASPATVAGATSYVAARLSLLADIVAYTKRGGGHINSVLLPLRHSLETDRFGFVAHTLVVADRCSSDRCAALALLDNPSQVRANLSGQTLDRYLDRYLALWAQAPAPGTPVADAAPTGATQPNPPSHKIVDIDFPSAASIPAVSIMNPEPPGPPAAAAVAAATAGEPKAESKAEAKTEAKAEAKPHEPPAAARHVQRKPSPPPPAQAAAAAPAVDPVWQPRSDAPAPAAPAAAAPVASAPPPVTGPVQLYPFPPPAAPASPKSQ